MDIESKIEHGRFIINRFDHYYEGINSKSSYYIGMNTALTTGLIALWDHGKDKNLNIHYSSLLLLASSVCIIGSFYYLFRSVNPFTKTGDLKSSLLFFGTISKMSQTDYSTKFKELDSELWLNDYTNQIHVLATGLDKKFLYLRYSGYFLWTNFPLLILLLLHTIN